MIAADVSPELLAGTEAGFDDTTGGEMSQGHQGHRGPRRDGSPTAWSHLGDALREYAIVLLDPDGIVTDWSAGAELLFRYSPADIVGQGFAALFTPAEVEDERPVRDLSIALADGWFGEESWRPRADGQLFWASTDLVTLRGHDERLLGFGLICRDQTERRRGEELLRESEERFRLLVNSVADYAIFLLDQEGRVASWNLGAERLKGYRADEILGRHFSTFYTTHDIRSGTPAHLLLTATQNGRVESEGWRVRRDGSQFWASVVITALHAADGTSRGYAKVTKDLTERKRNEDALRGVLMREQEAAAQLRELDTMRSQMVGVVAHDLRAPLTVVQGLVQAAREDWPTLTDDEKLHQLDVIEARLEGMSALVDDLFDMVQIESGQLQTVEEMFDLAGIAERAVADAVSASDAGRVVLDVERAGAARGDSHRTWEVMVNLVSNALKFSPPSTPVYVCVEPDGEWAAVSVTDEGPGVPEAQRHLLFQRFSRLNTASKTSGAGIGLYIARSMIEAQGGTIGMRPTPQGGSTFWFRLPGMP